MIIESYFDDLSLRKQYNFNSINDEYTETFFKVSFDNYEGYIILGW
jgi:hypothetical protein